MIVKRGPGIKRKARGKASKPTLKRTSRQASKPDYFTIHELTIMMSVLAVKEIKILDDAGHQDLGHFEVLSPKFQERILEARRDRLLLTLGLDLGARVNEIVGPGGLRWDRSLNLDRKQILVVDHKKGGAIRQCVIPEETWKLLLQYRNLLSCYMKGSIGSEIFPFTYKTANRKLKTWCKEVGMTGRVHFHMLRHTHVVLGRKAGRDWNFLSQQTGDTLSTLVEIYGFIDVTDMNQMVNQAPLIPKADPIKGGESNGNRNQD
jgi:integrase